MPPAGGRHARPRWRRRTRRRGWPRVADPASVVRHGPGGPLRPARRAPRHRADRRPGHRHGVVRGAHHRRPAPRPPGRRPRRTGGSRTCGWPTGSPATTRATARSGSRMPWRAPRPAGGSRDPAPGVPTRSRSTSSTPRACARPRRWSSATCRPATLQTYLDLGDAARQRIEQAWGSARPAVIVAPADHRRAAGASWAAGRSPASTRSPRSPTARSPPASPHRATGSTSTRPPFARLSPAGRGVVVTHELTHVTLRATTTRPVPIWLSEGYADRSPTRRRACPQQPSRPSCSRGSGPARCRTPCRTCRPSTPPAARSHRSTTRPGWPSCSCTTPTAPPRSTRFYRAIATSRPGDPAGHGEHRRAHAHGVPRRARRHPGRLRRRLARLPRPARGLTPDGDVAAARQERLGAAA